jgi:hypothetical protein
MEVLVLKRGGETLLMLVSSNVQPATVGIGFDFPVASAVNGETKQELSVTVDEQSPLK